MFFILSESRDGGKTWTDLFDRHYESGERAQAVVKTMNACRDYTIRYRVRKVVDTDSDNFYAREAAKGLTPITMDGLPDHVYWPKWRLPHIDPENKRHIRCFKTLEDAVECRYTSVKMSRFFAIFCDLEPEEFEDKLVKLGYYEGLRQFKILRDADEIQCAYQNGPRSCMNDPIDYPLGDIHPARVYGSPDLGVAVIMCEDECVARAVVWPEKKIYATIYGHGALLKKELEALGYRRTRAQSTWRGARILKIWDKKEWAYVCPYLDMSYTVRKTRDGKYLRLAGQDGPIGSQECTGFAYAS